MYIHVHRQKPHIYAYKHDYYCKLGANITRNTCMNTQTHNIYTYFYIVCVRYYVHVLMHNILMYDYIHIYMYDYIHKYAYTCIYVHVRTST